LAPTAGSTIDLAPRAVKIVRHCRSMRWTGLREPRDDPAVAGFMGSEARHGEGR
jgi:hypothetical protein